MTPLDGVVRGRLVAAAKSPARAELLAEVAELADWNSRARAAAAPEVAEHLTRARVIENQWREDVLQQARSHRALGH